MSPRRDRAKRIHSMKDLHTTVYRKGWEEDYKRKLVSAHEAVSIVKSGDVIATPLPRGQPLLLCETLCQRRDELRNVTVLSSGLVTDPGWFQPGWEESFSHALVLYIGAPRRTAVDERRLTYLPCLFSTQFKTIDEERPEKKDIDVFLTVVSPPDKNGFCSFGADLWHKRSYAKRAKHIIAEVDAHQYRFYGNGYIHVSEVDYFVEHTIPLMTMEQAEESLKAVEPQKRRNDALEVARKFARANPVALGRLVDFILGQAASRPDFDPKFLEAPLGLLEPSPEVMQIAENLKTVIRDGDTIQIGVGRPAVHMVELGVFDGFKDLGIHSEMGAPGMSLLVKNGVVTGKRKTLHPGKAVFASLLGCTGEDIEFAAENPIFEIYDAEYVVDIRTVAANENMVSINNGLQVDLTGQICSESQFGRLFAGQGGQPEMHMGAFLSRGGRAVTLLRSTAMKQSTIMPKLDEGSMVTIPRHFADIVITEYGIARLAGKDHRERAEALINVAHPDFRKELKKAAQNLFWP